MAFQWSCRSSSQLAVLVADGAAVAVTAVGRADDVAPLDGRDGADRHRLLAGVEVRGPLDDVLTEQVVDLLLEEPNLVNRSQPILYVRQRDSARPDQFLDRGSGLSCVYLRPRNSCSDSSNELFGFPNAIDRVGGPFPPSGGHHRTASDWGTQKTSTIADSRPPDKHLVAISRFSAGVLAPACPPALKWPATDRLASRPRANPRIRQWLGDRRWAFSGKSCKPV